MRFEALWAIITKIQSESKSQPVYRISQTVYGCEQSLRRYNLKANHNRLYSEQLVFQVVSNHYEDTIWKQITTGTVCERARIQLWAIITKIQSESKSQPVTRWKLQPRCCEQSLRRYNLKANHNWYGVRTCANPVVSNHYEDTIWKQITTIRMMQKLTLTLWAIITKIQSESKSQRPLCFFNKF